MQNSIDVLKRIETESKRFINIEKEGVIEEFHQCVFEQIFRKGMGYTFCSPMDWNDDQQLYIVNHKLKIKTYVNMNLHHREKGQGPRQANSSSYRHPPSAAGKTQRQVVQRAACR